MRAIAVAAVAVVLGQSKVGAAPAAAAVLRYHFVTGQTLTYQLSERDQIRQKIAGVPLPTDTSVNTYQVHYQFGKVTRSGEASLAMLIDHASVRDTSAGKSTVTATPAGTTYWIQAADGKQYTTDRKEQGAYSNGNLGLVPGRPIGVGDSWIAILANSVGIKGQQLSCTNVLRALSDSTAAEHLGAKVATIATTCAIAGTGIFANGGEHYNLQAKETLCGLWQFDVTAGHFLSQRQYETISASGTITDATGTHAYTVSQRQAITMRLLSVQG